MDEDKLSIIELAAEVVSSYVSNNSVASDQLPNLIRQVHGALSNVGSGATEAPPAKLEPAVPVRKSLTPEFIICLEDGRKFKSLKRHLRTKYDMSPEQYREKWGLAKDYPMVAPNYAASRSALAKSMGLGQGSRKPSAPAAAKAGRKPKA